MKIQDLKEEILLLQLAEECSELSQACTKMIRKIDGTNPAPKSLKDLRKGLMEEIADVDNAIDEVEEKLGLSFDEITGICEEKKTRWQNRLPTLEGK